MSDIPQIPPIPSAALVDRDGRVTREWWRWFHLVFTSAQATQTAIVQLTIEGGIPLDGQPSGEGVFADAPTLIPPDPGLSLEMSTLAALAQLVPPDPVTPIEQSAFIGNLIMPPPDTISPEQIVLQTLSLQVLA